MVDGDAAHGGRAVRPGSAAGPAPPQGDRRNDPRPAGRGATPRGALAGQGPAGRSCRQRRDRRRRLGGRSRRTEPRAPPATLQELRRQVAGGSPEDMQARFDLSVALFAQGPGRRRRSTSCWPSSAPTATGTTRRRASSWCASSTRWVRPIPLTVAVAPPAVVDPVLMTDIRRRRSDPLLPQTLAIFPLEGALLLPHGQLPLHIFEPRYRNMIEEALGNGRMLGMIQPRGRAAAAGAGSRRDLRDRLRRADRLLRRDRRWPLHGHPEGRLPLPGQPRNCRCFAGFRRVVPDYLAFRSDLEPASEEGIDRGRGC